MAIMDDINFWGPTEDVLDAYEFMAGELATLRLIANEKTTLHPPAAEHLIWTQLPKGSPRWRAQS